MDFRHYLAQRADSMIANGWGCYAQGVDNLDILFISKVLIVYVILEKLKALRTYDGLHTWHMVHVIEIT